MERLGTNLNEIDTTDCENSLESLQVILGDLITTIEQLNYKSFPFQQIAVKLYEKDPSKLTSVDEAIPAVSTSSDLSDDEEEDSNLAEVKEEPMEVVPNMSLAPPPSSHQEAEHSTDSDTVGLHRTEINKQSLTCHIIRNPSSPASWPPVTTWPSRWWCPRSPRPGGRRPPSST